MKAKKKLNLTRKPSDLATRIEQAVEGAKLMDVMLVCLSIGTYAAAKMNFGEDETVAGLRKCYRAIRKELAQRG
jgi:hypothetical protein